jgi:predicted ATPase
MQTLMIEGFLGIRSAEIELDGMTVLIGEQATGKSVVARLFFYFNEYFSGFDEISLSRNEHKGSYDKRKKDEFYQLFPTYSWEKDEFEITYSNDSFFINISSKKGSSVVELKTSPEVAVYFRELKKQFSEFKRASADDLRSDSHLREEFLASTRILREFRRLQHEGNIRRFEKPLFVPAARSFYATIRDEIFSILSIDNKIDRIILQFGDFFEFEKSARLRRGSAVLLTSNEIRYFKSIVKGTLIREDGRDWIQMDRGRIEIGKASSGQQEAIPLLLAISRFPQPGKTLIIEEPEAHLFPTAQVEILAFMVNQCVERNTSMMFTTHSPYLLSSLNVHLIKGASRRDGTIAPERVRAYSLKDGRSHDLIDRETNLVSADYIDSVSENIAEEFERALGELND